MVSNLIPFSILKFEYISGFSTHIVDAQEMFVGLCEVTQLIIEYKNDL